MSFLTSYKFSSDMVRFVKNVKEWFDQDKNNIIAVHCKGGKGRTGTMICVWLVEAGLFGTAEVSISYFCKMFCVHYLFTNYYYKLLKFILYVFK